MLLMTNVTHSGRIVKTVKVIIYVSEHGRISTGVVESEHRGATRVDHRVAPTRQTEHRVSHAPRGVSPAVWLAAKALQDVLDEQERAARSTGL